jgi:hypothetical protein
MRSSPKAGRPLLATTGLCVVLALSACASQGGPGTGPAPTGAPLLSGHVEHRAGDWGELEVQGSAGEADRLARLTAAAVAAVRRVLGGTGALTGDDLTVEVARDEASLEQALGAAPGTYRDVEAVSAAAPGAGSPGTPLVWVDAEAVGGLNDQGVEIVLTHEATHVLTGVVGDTAMPLWLVEGFADYVALRDVHKPLSVTAGRILAEVRRDGAPGRLPLAPDFDAAQATGGDAYTAEYEASWLACRLLARRGGEKALVSLYTGVRDGDSLAHALASGFGLTIDRFTRLWQTTLRTQSTRHR